MLPRLDAATVAPLTPADGAGAVAPVGDGRQAAFQRALQTLVGQQVQAEVMSKLGDGSFLVKVADNAVRMVLPSEVQVGAEVPLTVIAAQPRPTFEFDHGAARGNATTLVYSDTPQADAEPLLYHPPSLPSQEAPTTLPGQGRGLPAATPPGQAGGAAAGQAAGALAAETAEPVPLASPGAANQAGAAATAASPSTATPPAAPAAATPPAEPADPAATAAAAAAARRAVADPAASLASGGKTVVASATPAPPGADPASTGSAAGATAQAAAGQASVPTTTAVKPHSLAAALLGRAPLTPANELPELDPGTPQSTLSSTARVLTTVLGAVQNMPGGAAAALVGKAALFNGAPPAPEHLAQQLSDTIAQSGLFYESHLTEWVKGERQLPDLMREPQMQRQALGADNAARAAAAAAGPDLASAQMINMQLHAHEQSRVQWNGEAWPGQAMQWEIRREARDGGRQPGKGDGGDGDGAPPEPIWRSGVRFRFPILGQVSATVTLVGDQVHIQMHTDSETAAGTLRAYAGRLENAMAAAGAPLSSFMIGAENGDE